MPKNEAVMNQKPTRKTKLEGALLFRRSLRRLLGEGLLKQDIPKGIPLHGQALRRALNAMILE